MNNMEEYNGFLAQVRKETGIEAFSADEGGLVSLSVDDRYTVNLQFVESTGKVLCFIELMHLPKDSPKAIYRDLLVGGLFGKDTAGGYFALEPETETVVYNYFFELDKIAKDVDEFISTMEKMLQLCDIWLARITSGEATDEGNAKEAHSVRDHNFIAV
jgi:hypothetical protein